MKKFLISADLLQQVVNYLDTKPHREVTGLINSLLKECREQPTEQKEQKEHEGDS